MGKGGSRERGHPKVDVLYNMMQSYENKLGGGEGVEGLYGSITQHSMQKVLDALKRNTGLDQRSVFIDVGAGLGRPLLHAMVSASVASAWGVELDRVKCDKARAFCDHVVKGMISKEHMDKTTEPPKVFCKPVEKVDSLEPATHAYSFWEGVPVSGKKAFGRLFAQSRTLRAVAVVQRAMRGQEPAAVMHELGFGRLLLASFPVKMSGSGRSFMAYIFSKIAPAAATFLDAVVQGRTAQVTDLSSSSFADSVAGHSRCGRTRAGGGARATTEGPACGADVAGVGASRRRGTGGR